MIRNDTHEVRFDRARNLVIKRFRSTSRGEPAREWTALSLLARFAPGLAPAPVSADLSGDIPVITMSLLPGTELSAAPVTSAQERALAEALERLWRSVPAADLEYPAAVTPKPADFTRQVRAMAAAAPALGDDAVVARAYAEAAAWLERETPDHSQAGHPAVLGHGDPCLANYLWDDGRVRVVDFEDSGPSDRAFELAILTEHISAWSDARLDAGDLLALFDLTRAERARVRDFRRLAALFWLIMLRPGSASSARNPPVTLERQADRLLGLLALRPLPGDRPAAVVEVLQASGSLL
jgi:aminoglycoside phosphotransferase (APT) family kinase protein